MSKQCGQPPMQSSPTPPMSQQGNERAAGKKLQDGKKKAEGDGKGHWSGR